MSSGDDAWGRFARPLLASRMAIAGLDWTYEHGAGATLHALRPDGREARVLDLVGGYGAALFGHAHPALVAVAQEALRTKRSIQAQASVRADAGRLAAALSERIGRSTGREYVSTFASTGAESIEAAMKHAEM